MGGQEKNEPYGNRVGRCGLDASGLGYGPLVSSCGNGNEASGSIKGGNFLAI